MEKSVKIPVTGFRFSPQQVQLWKSYLSGIGSSLRALSVMLIKGPSNKAIVKKAFEDVVYRNEILHTRFMNLSDGTPVQIIASSHIEWGNEQDWSRLSQQQQEALINETFEQVKQFKFEHEQNPLFYVSTAILSPTEYVLIIGLSALCADASTLESLTYELCRSYERCFLVEGFNQSSIQYTAIAEWLNDLAVSEDTQKGRAYWLEQRVKKKRGGKLLWERGSYQEKDFDPRVSACQIEEYHYIGLSQFASSYETSIENVMLACWLILLWRLCGEQWVVVDVAYDGRIYQELKTILGPLTRFLPLTAHLQSALSFREVLELVKNKTSETSAWQHYYFEEQTDGLTEGNRRGYAFQFVNLLSHTSKQDVTVSIYKQYTCEEPFKIKLSCVYKPNTLFVEFHYDNKLFDIVGIERLAAQYLKIVESIHDNSEEEIEKLNIISESERRQLLVSWNETYKQHDSKKCIHELFEAQVFETPDNIAITCEGQRLNYRDLNEKANQLAHFLHELGIGSEAAVGIYVDRSIEMVIGLLGVLKSGGIYVSLDPDYPSERIDYMIRDAGIKVLLTQQWLFEDTDSHQIPIICIDTGWDIIDQYSKSNLTGQTMPENLAYIMYTSGSTGWPKGVMLTHEGGANLARAQIRIFDVHPRHKVLQFASLSFDASVSEIFMALISGATLSLDMSNHLLIGDALADLLENEKITHLTIPPSILSTLQPREIRNLQIIIVAGEACDVDLVRRWAEGRQFFNAYGPTEYTVCATVCHISDKNRTPPIGRPIDNTSVYVLDSRLEPLPIGMAGRLFISGIGLARGYINRPDLTAEHFIPNPFSKNVGERLYDTGDLAFFLPDGNLEFIGRADRQVKVHGIRIELGEIESVLISQESVRDCIVVAHGVGNNQQLVAYVITEEGESLHSSQLRNYLRKKLPRHMDPTSYMFLKEWPLTPNGKLDKKVLPIPEAGQRDAINEYVPPSTPIEEKLTELWAELLVIEKVGVLDNFFDLGGHSLLSAKIISNIRVMFEVSIPLRRLFEYPTIRELAKNIEKVMTASKHELPSLPESPNRQIEIKEPRNVSLIFDWIGPLDTEILQQDIKKVMNQHNVVSQHDLILTNGERAQNNLPLQLLPLEFIDMRTIDVNHRESEARQLVNESISQNVNHTNNLSLRIQIFQLNDLHHLISLIADQSIADDWPIDKLLRDALSISQAHSPE